MSLSKPLLPSQCVVCEKSLLKTAFVRTDLGVLHNKCYCCSMCRERLFRYKTSNLPPRRLLCENCFDFSHLPACDSCHDSIRPSDGHYFKNTDVTVQYYVCRRCGRCECGTDITPTLPIYVGARFISCHNCLFKKIAAGDEPDVKGPVYVKRKVVVNSVGKTVKISQIANVVGDCNDTARRRAPTKLTDQNTDQNSPRLRTEPGNAAASISQAETQTSTEALAPTTRLPPITSNDRLIPKGSRSTTTVNTSHGTEHRSRRHVSFKYSRTLCPFLGEFSCSLSGCLRRYLSDWALCQHTAGCSNLRSAAFRQNRDRPLFEHLRSLYDINPGFFFRITLSSANGTVIASDYRKALITIIDEPI